MKQSKQTAKQFIKLDIDSLRGLGLNLTEKVLISYLKGWQSQDKVCYERNVDIAEYLEVDESTLRRTIKKLVDKGIVFYTRSYKTHHSINRKAIVYVDTNNPLPIKEVNQPEVKIKKVIVPEVIDEIVAEVAPIETTTVVIPNKQPSVSDIEKGDMRKFVTDNRYNILGIHKDELKSLIRRGKITLDEIKEKYYVDHSTNSGEEFIEAEVVETSPLNIDPMSCDEDDFLKLLDN